jgi:formylglycine-generating enzyme required for sulfatase activity
MSGNVGEWCDDLFSGNDHGVDPHAIRGGGWGHPAGRCKTTVRTALKPGQPADSVGFRTFRTVIWE